MPKIQKPWCIYLHGTPTGVGKVVEESKSIAWVAYYERHSGEPWDKKYLWRFATIAEAILKFNEYGARSPAELKIILLRKFPSEQKEIEATIRKAEGEEE